MQADHYLDDPRLFRLGSPGAVSRRPVARDWFLTLALAFLIAAGTDIIWHVLWATFDLHAILFATIIGGLGWLSFRILLHEWRIRYAFLVWALLFGAANVVSCLDTWETHSRLGTWLYNADDADYLAYGTTFREFLINCDSIKGYRDIYSTLPVDTHSAYGLLLGHLFQFVPADERLYIRAAVLFNIHCYLLCMGILIRVSGACDRRWWQVCALSVSAGFQMMYVSVLVLKDSIVLLLMLTLVWQVGRFTSSAKRGGSMVIALCCALALTYLRILYAGVAVVSAICGSCLRKSVRRQHRSKAAALILAMAVLALVVSHTPWYDRALTAGTASGIASDMYRDSTGSNGAAIYRVPGIGPIMYTLLSPLPPTPKTATAMPWVGGIATGVSNIFTLWIMLRVFYAALRRKQSFHERTYGFVLLGIGCLVAASYGSLEPRHKLAAVTVILLLYADSFFRRACPRRHSQITLLTKGRDRLCLEPE